MTTELSGEGDLFTPEFKYLKSKSPSPDLTRVIDLSQLDSTSPASLPPAYQGIGEYPIKDCGLRPLSGLKSLKDWKCYRFTGYPGLIVINNPFINGYQRYWVYRCLQDFVSVGDNVTNLTSLGDDSSRCLWQEFVNKKSQEFDKHDPLRKLRWTTLGYHYNWTTKEYSDDHKSPFPADVSCLSQYLAACLDLGSYQAQAAIVNYYHLDSTLAGHTDHSEVDHSAPLFSISFGQTAIFLLGGHTKSVKPMSIFLRSGDICVMSGACRLAYHAVPRILAPSPDTPLPNCFNLTHACRCVLHGDTPSVNTCTDFSINSTEVKTCPPHMLSLHNKSDLELATTDSPSISECDGEHKENHTTSDKQNLVTRNSQTKIITKVIDKQWGDKIRNDYNSVIDEVNHQLEQVLANLDFTPFKVYLKSSRINLNVRQVLPPGCSFLNKQTQEKVDI